MTGPLGGPRPFAEAELKIVFFLESGIDEQQKTSRKLEEKISKEHEKIANKLALKKARVDVYFDGSRRPTVETDKNQLNNMEIDTISEAVEEVIGDYEAYTVMVK